ncbi:hypothetical protein EON82_23035 [bacterium]|nr:MAG: hypothetical protein EON82_23035 [bacterium]
MTKYIAKANNDVLSHCTCEGEIAAGPNQLDCPWCGCGWLISCMKCSKTFTFARVIDVDRTYEDIVAEDFARRGVEASDEEIDEGAEWMAEAFADLTVGDIVVYLDGAYFSLGTKNFVYDGWFAQHEFDQLPHAVALVSPAALRETLGDKEYWIERELVDEEE